MRALVTSLAFACVVAGCDSTGLWSAPRDHEDGTSAASGSSIGSNSTGGSGGHGSTSGSTTSGSSGTTTGTTDTGSTSSSGTTGTTTSTTTSSTGTTGLQTVAEVDVMGTVNLGSSNTSTYDLAIATNGTLYASDCGDNAIITFAGGNGTLFAGGTGLPGHHDGQGTSAALACPYGMVFINNTLYVMDSGDGSEYSYLRSVDGAANVGSVCGNGQDSSAVNGTCANAQFSDPKGIAVDGAGNIYVADDGANTVRRIEHDFSSVSTWAGSGSHALTNGQGLQAAFDGPTALAVDASGDVFVADYTNNAIRKIDPNRNVTTFATAPGAGFAFMGVAVDASGNVYASDENLGHILRWSPDGTLTAEITDSAISNPSCMKIGPDGKLWVADISNGILKISF
ncbi:MAG: hypothetical protein JST54_28715 [Deltaproteobacteria bacterium]|nr:hypothetical protein [Deltaproteobacteria bacterium]